tara:strand:+ start:2080 stop:2280 length:201 start_codon:yes stop_codon:yes gene_type:complete
MGNEKNIMSQILKLHKKIDYLTDEVMTRLDEISDKVSEEEDDPEFPFAPKPQGINEIKIINKGDKQ